MKGEYAMVSALIFPCTISAAVLALVYVLILIVIANAFDFGLGGLFVWAAADAVAVLIFGVISTVYLSSHLRGPGTIFTFLVVSIVLSVCFIYLLAILMKLLAWVIWAFTPRQKNKYSL